MKTGDLVDTLSFFSNEIVGTLLPGFVLLTGLRVFHFGFEIPSWIQSGNGIWFAVVVVLAFSYVAGHGLLALRNILIPYLGRSSGKLYKSAENGGMYRAFSLRVRMLEILRSGRSVGKANDDFPDNLNFNDRRNLAMSLSTEAAVLGRRFMFIALFSYGVAVALFVFAVYAPLVLLIRPDLAALSLSALAVRLGIFLLVLVGLIFWHRGESFERRAYSAPFSAALAELLHGRIEQ